MQDDEFEWDDEKATANLSKHGISFENVRGVFYDPRQIDKIEDSMDYSEERRLILGQANGLILAVVYTERMGRFRIISARKADRNEQHEYYTEHPV